MKDVFSLEIRNDNHYLDVLAGDEITVSVVDKPRGDGKDLAVFVVAGEFFISAFTCFGNQFILLGERITTIRKDKATIVGKVVGSSFCRENKKAAAATATLLVQSAN